MSDDLLGRNVSCEELVVAIVQARRTFTDDCAFVAAIRRLGFVGCGNSIGSRPVESSVMRWA